MNEIDEIISDLKRLQEHYKKRYGDGLVGIDENYIQLGPDLFKQVAKDRSKVKLGAQSKGIIELQYEDEGYLFITVI